MSRTFHLLTGEYPPHAGGVGDYTQLLAVALAEQGCRVHVWCPDVDASVEREGVQLHRLPDRFGRAARRCLEQALSSTPGCLLLQYVPNALGARGANLPFCFWLLRMGRRRIDVRVMFHEPYFYFALGRPIANVLAIAQRAMAALLLRAARVVYLSTDTWKRYLGPYGRRDTRWTTLPIPSTIPAVHQDVAVAHWRARVVGQNGRRLIGHFGTFGDHLSRELEPLVPALLTADPAVHLLCIGRRSEAFAATLAARHPELGARIHASGPLPRAELAAALKACDLVVQPYPDGVTTRRTSVMAGLANGVATLTTCGRLTEEVWAATGAVALAPASNAEALTNGAMSLLADDRARARLAATGRRVYDERFALDHTVRTLCES